jgi:hypothetical protein
MFSEFVAEGEKATHQKQEDIEEEHMIALVCFEGLGPDSSYPKSFMKTLANKWPDQYMVEYVYNGNTGLGKTIDQKAQEGEQKALALLSQPGVEHIFLAGYSQGGAAAIVVGQKLQKHGYDVGLLALMDAVSADPGGRGIWFNPPISSNVKHAVHGYRNASTDSRPLWGNCGLASFVDSRNYWITHGGASGGFYLENPAGPPNPGQLVTEIGLLGEERVTQVNQYYEWNSAMLLWDWYWGKVQTYRRLVLAGDPKGAPKNPGAKPGNGNGNAPGNGNGNGNGKSQTHIVKSGESLSIIAGKYWSDVLLWPALWDANKPSIPNPNLIHPGDKLTVPSITGYSQSELAAFRQRGRSY